MGHIKSEKEFMSNVFIWALICLTFVCFSFLFFSKVNRYEWMYVGDSLNSLMAYSYHYSGIARGEYPIWNPLIRAGTNDIMFNILGQANPILNLESLFFVLLKNKDLIFAFSVFIYTMIIAYMVGTFFLVSCWCNNRYAGIFAGILAMGSSTVLFYTYHVSFIQLLYAIPWILYSLTMYFKEFRLKFLILFLLSFCVFLYSYEFIMGLTFFIALLFSYLLFYFKSFLAHLRRLNRIPFKHVLLIGCVLLSISLPIFLTFFQYKNELLPISRIADLNVSNTYTLTFKNLFYKITSRPLFSREFFFIISTGYVLSGIHDLRHFVGIIAILFMATALLSLRRDALCLAVAGFFVFMLSGNVFPMSLLFGLPIFDSIRNLHFILQYFLFTLIILAGFGFNFLTTADTHVQFRKIFVYTAIFLVISLLASLILFTSLFFNNITKPWFIRHYFSYNFTMIFMSLLAVSMLLYIWISASSIIRKTGLILAVTAMFTVLSFFIINQLPVLSGGLHNNTDLFTLRKKTNYSLNFVYERPKNIQIVDLNEHRKEWETDFGMDEYSSLFTLKDNSYKSIKGGRGLSSFPILKRYYLFLSLHGSDTILKRKFFFLENFFISNNPQDMLIFKKDPILLTDMVNKQIGMIDKVNHDDDDMSLGQFNPSNVRGVLSGIKNKRNKYFLPIVKEYKANSIILKVSNSRKALLLYTDLWDRGWHAEVDGKPASLKKVFQTFKGVVVPKGVHEIKFYYINSAYYPILLMNIIFLMLLAGLIGNLVFHRLKPMQAIKLK